MINPPFPRATRTTLTLLAETQLRQAARRREALDECWVLIDEQLLATVFMPLATDGFVRVKGLYGQRHVQMGSTGWNFLGGADSVEAMLRLRL